VSAAQQFAADSGAGLNIAASSIACQGKFHDESCLSVVVPVGEAKGHYLWFFDCRLGFAVGFDWVLVNAPM
jgi:hypothetical protein